MGMAALWHHALFESTSTCGAIAGTRVESALTQALSLPDVRLDSPQPARQPRRPARSPIR
ncbi:hypothetical protein NITHO_4000004 [Nitrolancea hollandica Lb]|uniref:Uncharacterized protein n=1 Tax=Nitrolancea hollandica Lb TaxID=1129897 RepID=I4EJG0_9BACT|nr:hypothetical protein NITHO_4000004 [Nitrolancea hollandica Lb]